jgi:hypothetical protein
MKHVVLRRTFETKGDFEAFNQANAFLRAHGFSHGPGSIELPQGVMFGAYFIAKWPSITAADRDALDGLMSGDGRNGPITVEIYSTAPPDALAAIINVKKGNKMPEMLQHYTGEIAVGDTVDVRMKIAEVTVKDGALIFAPNSHWFSRGDILNVAPRQLEAGDDVLFSFAGTKVSGKVKLIQDGFAVIDARPLHACPIIRALAEVTRTS